MTITITSAEIINPISVAIAGVGTAGSGGTGGGAVDSVNGKIGTVVLTKTDLSLGNADNTSDLNKPISNATQSALDMKQPLGAYLTSETDPVFLASQAHNITMGHITVLNATSGTNTGDQDLSGLATKVSLSAVATSGSYTDLSNKPTIPTVPTAVSAFTNDSGYLSSITWSTVSGKPTFSAVATSGDHASLSNIGTRTHAQLESDIALAKREQFIPRSGRMFIPEELASVTTYGGSYMNCTVFNPPSSFTCSAFNIFFNSTASNEIILGIYELTVEIDGSVTGTLVYNTPRTVLAAGSARVVSISIPPMILSPLKVYAQAIWTLTGVNITGCVNTSNARIFGIHTVNYDETGIWVTAAINSSITSLPTTCANLTGHGEHTTAMFGMVIQ